MKKKLFALLFLIPFILIGTKASADITLTNDFETFDGTNTFTGPDFDVRDVSSSTSTLAVVTPGLNGSGQAAQFDVQWDGNGGTFANLLEITQADLVAAGFVLDSSLAATLSIDYTVALSAPGGNIQVRNRGGGTFLNQQFGFQTGGTVTQTFDLAPVFVDDFINNGTNLGITIFLPERNTALITLDNITIVQASAIPEPGSIAFILGCGSVLLCRRRRC